jgi:S-DNA-T family DNA segregation ATPase FtsK/SpoIIIE
VARRKASRTGYAKPAGAALIALALLAGVSLVPHQTAPAPQFIAARLGQGFGAGAAVLPVICVLVGLIFFVREKFYLSPRIWGVLAAYLVALVALHLRYGAGREFLAAFGRKGGGYAGALLEVALRRMAGEPGLWTAMVLGAAASVLLISGVSLTGALRAVLRALGAAGTGALRALGVFGASAFAAAVAGLRWMCRAAMHAGRLVAGEAKAALTRCSVAAASVLDRVREGLPRHGPLEPGHPGAGGGGFSGLDPLLVSAGAVTGAAPPRHGAAPIPDRDAPPLAETLTEAAVADAPGRESPPEPAPDMAAAGGSEGATARTRLRRRRASVVRETPGFSAEPVRSYTLPDLALLESFPPGKARNGKVDPEEVARNLEKTLASFGVEARVIRWEIGPVVTRYELQPAPGVKVQRITSLQNDIALGLAASSVRLEAPIPGKSAVGVELPNERPGLVHLREILTSEEFLRAQSPLTVAIGKGIAGTPVVADLVAMPHLLIAGATGAGKSVAINSMIASILFRATPEQVRLLMIDPKRVELTNYNGIPHLLSPVVTGPREAAAKLRWAIQEMESRYEVFAAEGVRNIQAFNAQHPDRPLAYILIIIDELADLMMVAPADFEEIICRLAQMTRATGIHLLIATQRPSVDVITGLIKANIPSRVAFSVSSQVDSRTILDHPGAEKLLGRGDMLFAPVGATRPTRVQGAFIGDAETERLVQFWRAQGEPAYVESLMQAGGGEAAEESSNDDTLLMDAARLVVRAGYASVSLLQRKMRIGYVRAARVVDQLEEKGIVGPSQGSSPRDVLMGIDELERVIRAGPAPSSKPSGDESPGEP